LVVGGLRLVANRYVRLLKETAQVLHRGGPVESVALVELRLNLVERLIQRRAVRLTTVNDALHTTSRCLFSRATLIKCSEKKSLDQRSARVSNATALNSRNSIWLARSSIGACCDSSRRLFEGETRCWGVKSFCR